MTTPQAAAQPLMFGIDAASSQHDVDWATVDNSTGFGFEKVTQGTSYLNPYWAKAKPAMAARAKATGFVPGAYLFLNEGNGAAQADWFAQNAGDLDGFMLAVDIEPWSAGHSRPTLQDGKDCVARLRHHYPAHPVGGYIPQWYWDSQDTTFCDWLWQSRYLLRTGTPRELYPHVPADWWTGYGGLDVTLLQFTSSATVGGVAGLVDCSAYRGHPADLRKLTLPPTAPQPFPSGRHVVSDNPGTLAALAKLQGVDVTDIWWATVLGGGGTLVLPGRPGHLQRELLNSGKWDEKMKAGTVLYLP